jgi:hypothetical protein
MYDGCKFLSVVTGMPVVKQVFQGDKEYANGTEAFLDLAGKCVGVAANNMISLNEVKQIYKGNTWYIPRGVDPSIFKKKKWEVIDTPPGEGGPPFTNLTNVFVGKANSGKGLNRYIQPACGKAGVHCIVNERNYTNALTKEQMCDFYNQGHTYVVASVTDGTPNPALEAAACGRVIISNKIGNMPEFIKSGKNGWLIQKRDENKYMEYLRWVRKHPKEAEEMGNKARQTILDGWTWEHCMERERKMLREIFA